MQCYPTCDEEDARDLYQCWYLMQDDDPNYGGGCRQQGEQQRKRCSRQPGHGELSTYIRDDRRANTDTDAREEQQWLVDCRQGPADPNGGNGQQSDEHRCSQPINACCASILGDPVAEDYVEHEEGTVGKSEHKPQRLSAEAGIRQEPSARGCQKQCANVPWGPYAECSERDRAKELDSSNRS